MKIAGAAASAALVALAAALIAAGDESEGKRWWAHIQVLADDGMQGRDTGSEAHRRAAQYVATQFEKAGLEPAGTQGYLQPVKFDVRRLEESASSLELERGGKTERLALGEDAIIGIRTDPAEDVEAPLVFAGYGFAVPELQYDDLDGIDLRGKIVVSIAGAPSNIPGPLRAHYQSAAERSVFLRRAGAIGTVSIPNPRHMDIPWDRLKLSRTQAAMSLADPALQDGRGMQIGVMVNPARAGRWLEGSGHSLADLLALADAGKPLPRFPLNARLRAHAKVERSQVESQNVAGVLRGSDPALKDQYVVVSAHVDHVGVGAPIHGDRIYNGAMDDASGIATIIEMARRLHEENARPKRSLLFVAVTGEEKGLLGSRYYAAHPTVPAASLVADLNVDMFLPLFPLRSVTAYGLHESDLGDILREVAAHDGVAVEDDREPERNIFVRSDQYSFIRRGVPSICMKVGYEKGSKEEQIAKTWLKERYHAPSDDLNQPVDLQCAAGFDRLMLALAEAVADRAERPHWKPDSFFKRFAN